MAKEKFLKLLGKSYFMPDGSKQEKNERLNLLVKKEKAWFKDEHNKVSFLAKSIPILVLGDHSIDGEKLNVMGAVIENLRKESYSAIPLKDVSDKGNHIYNEREAMRRYDVIIKLEDKEKAGAGTIGENVLISGEKEIQERVFLFVKSNRESPNSVFEIEHYFLYFPRTYFCKNEEDMIEKATKIAIMETFRLAYNSIREGKKA